MSVAVMLIWLWWGLLGFLSVVAGVWAFVSVLGPKGRLILVLLVGTVGGRLLEGYFTADQRCADGFLTAWAAESADFPKGRAYTEPVGQYLDYDRLVNVNPYLCEHLRMRWRSEAQSAGREDVQTAGQQSPVPSKVYVADARVYSGELDRTFRARIRIWIARDNHMVAKFAFENIVLQ